jgi:hypothetical protein
MATYLFHYCYDQPAPITGDFVEHLNNPKPPVQLHARWVTAWPYELEYSSDVAEIEKYLFDSFANAGNPCRNFQLLSWQRLHDGDRPAEAV